MNPVLANLLRTEEVAGPDGRKFPLHSHLPELEGRLLQSWLDQHRPSRLLEVGLAYGVSTLFICDVVCRWPVDFYHVIDPHQSGAWKGIGRSNIDEAGFGHLVTVFEQLSELCLPQFLAQGHRYDFAFVDGMHTFDHVLIDFFYINRMLDTGGVVVFDDVDRPAVAKALSYIEGFDCYQRLELPDGFPKSTPMKVRQVMGLTPIRIAGFVKIAEDARGWDWYRDF